MQAALGLAGRVLGQVWPNPAVGCVLVRPDLGGRVVGRGWTQPGGRPHAETEALKRAGDFARGATAYISLEPCDHHGRTPPCSEALIAAGIRRCVAAVEDPDPRVSGKGLERLRAAGIDVRAGVLEREAARLNAGFFLRVKEGRPLFTLKVATTLDGRIATRAGESRWITGEGARLAAHRLRAEHDAVMIGIGTALADDPELTCRLPGCEWRSPVRIVLDSRLRLPAASKLATTARLVPTWVITTEPADERARGALAALGVEIIDVEAGKDGRPDLARVAEALGHRGLTRVLVEGGAALAGALVGRGLIDGLVWFRAPKLIGDGGVPAAAGLDIADLAQAPAFMRTSVRELGADVVETYGRSGN
ncbi:MAG: bifunctional diaminohydroxyphosphoribosylaminopyrimidine deaminase/5-amino-6-(5-phosphoribosylamino)uracil reductase RibD [Rhodospirillales bacterium]|nr:bifunctional diaminohydroxyphosphoribosylaminopyrimidine deaminase/5-amino-6-(5-phosphoribosylamino)uracil reductase RibD [Rhodospirillales bacterium]